MELFTENPLVPKIVQLLVLVLSLATVIKGQGICATLQPCQNFGSCYDNQADKYTCTCVGDYTGQNCTSLKFEARIGISELIARSLIPHLAGVVPPDLTNFNALRQFRSLSLDITTQTPFPKKFRWTLNGKTMQLKKEPTNDRVYITINGDLRIQGGMLTDEGEYQVFMSNDFGTMFSRKVGLKFSVAGSFDPSPSINISMTENEAFLLRCPPRAYSYRVSYDWEKRGGVGLSRRRRRAINPSFEPRILMEPSGDLLFSPVRASDVTSFMSAGGSLRCTIRDRFLIARTSKDVFFHVISSASQKSSLKFYTTPAGSYTLATRDQFYLNCTAGGSFTPDILWYKDNVLIIESGDLFRYKNHNRTLRLGSLNSRSHDGAYKCVAEGNSGSGALRVETTTTIKVIDKVEPVYSKDNPNYDIRAGKHGGSVKLFCNTTGGSRSSPIWYYNGVKLQYSSKFANRWSVDSSSEILTIRNLQVKDFGLFQCVVKNPVSEHYRVSFLAVTGAPLPPVSVNTTICANFSTTLTWEIRLLPDLLPPDGFIIEWAAKYLSSQNFPLTPFSKLAEIPSGSARSYFVDKLKPHNEIHFRIRAKNKIGVGFPGLAPLSPLCITNSKRPALYPKNLKVNPTKINGELNISWTPLNPLYWSGANCVYRIFYRPNNTNATWTNTTSFGRCDLDFKLERGVLTNTVYEVKIRTENSEGPGPTSPSVFGLSGQSPPRVSPTDITVVRMNSSSVELKWVTYAPPLPATVDGHWIYLWKGPRTYNIRLQEFEEISPFILVIPDDAIRVEVRQRGVTRGVVTGLTPWTEYSVAVQGYNNAGLGPFSVQDVSVRTLDSKDSYYMLTLRITSEIFTDDLKDPTSSRFKTLKENVTTEISKLYSQRPWFKRANVLSFSPGSVQADIQLEAASPNMSYVQEVVSLADNLGNFSLDRNDTKVQSQPAIHGVTLQASHLMVNVTARFVINCAVIGGPPDLQITWSKGGNVIGLTHRTKVETGVGRSRLTVRDVMASDDGVYVCQAIKGSQIATSSVAIGVVPVLEILPRAVTKRVGDEATFTCGVVSGFRSGASVIIVEVTTKGNEVRHQQMNLTSTNLEIPEGAESHVRKFVCEMWFEKRVLSKSEVAELNIIKQDVPKCPEELLEGVLWSATAAGQMDVKPCPHGARGTASRTCSKEAVWENSNFVGCSSNEFLRLGDEMEAITESFQSNFTAQQILLELVNVTQPVENSTKRAPEVFGGDLVIAMNVLVQVADYNAEQGNVSTEQDVENFAEVASNLLEPVNTITWQELENLGKGQGQTLVKAVDDYGLGVAATFTGSTNSRVVQTTNLLLRIDRANKGSPLRDRGLIVSYNRSSIQLPAEAFSSSPDPRVITLVYLTLNDVLPLDKEKKNNKQPFSANTTIVSSTVHPRSPDVFKQPVKIKLQNKRVSVPSGVTPKGSCVFWRPRGESAVWQTSGCRLVADESDDKMTTCECDHLTIFASIMDPFGSSIGEAHKKALEIISIVGCSISLLAVTVTMIVTLFFWRALKSPRAKVLLNLCAVIAISCILVISEGSARDNKTGCTVIAALLHYFLLALFCWMLCEGVLLYILLVKVFGGGADDKVKYFYLLGWGFPAVIVAISLAATQADGYGTSEACWLDVKSGLIWAFVAPALLIILINTVVFFLVIRQMMGTRHVQSKTQIEKVKAGAKASAVVLPLLGITWLFGLLSFNSSTVAFKYIFAIANSLQGLMIFIFHCLLNKQIKDAIKRRREKSSSVGVSTTPKTKPSPIQNPKHATNLPAKAKKKWSNKAQNDYEMVDSIASAKSQSDSTLPNSRDNKNAIIKIPDEQNITVEPEEPKMSSQEKQQNNTQPFHNDKESSPEITSADKTGNKDSEEGSADEKTSTSSFITNETQRNGLTREGSSTEPNKGEQLVHDYMGSIDGITNHIYEKPPDDYVPFFDETHQREEARLSLKDEVRDNVAEIGDERTPRNTFTQSEEEASQEGPSKDEKLVHDDRSSEDGVSNRIYENTPNEYAPSFIEIQGTDEDSLRLEQRRPSSSSSSNSEMEYVEISEEVPPVINQEEVVCVVEDAPSPQGAMPSDSDDTLVSRRTAKKVEPREFGDDVKNDEDFDRKMTERRAKVDSVQAAAEEFKSNSQKFSTETRLASGSVWMKIRQKIYKESYKVKKNGNSPDQSTNREDVYDDVDDHQLV